MNRYLTFEKIQQLVLQEGLMIRQVNTGQTLLLSSCNISGNMTTTLVFTDEERNIPQTIDPHSVWELVNYPDEL